MSKELPRISNTCERCSAREPDNSTWSKEREGLYYVHLRVDQFQRHRFICRDCLAGARPHIDALMEWIGAKP